jgi:hypothetical protein
MQQSMTQYVKVVSEAINLVLDDAQIERVAAHLERTQLMSKDLMALDFSPELELVEIFVPSPYLVDLPLR